MTEKFIPFGSMCNSFGLINHGKGIGSEEFINAMRSIYEYAEELAEPKQIKNDTTRTEISIPK